MTEHVVSLPEALAIVNKHAAIAMPAREEEYVSLHHAAERVLAGDILADRDQPPFARSTRDGYAIHSQDLRTGSALRVVGQIRAGEQWDGADLAAGEALEIMTGAPLPAGADAVLMVEHASYDDATHLLIPETGRVLEPGSNVVPQGAEARAGERLLSAGRRLGPQQIAIVAGAGYATVGVAVKPRVAILATGDELRELPTLREQAPREIKPFAIYNSNGPALAAAVQRSGGEPERLPIAKDTLDDLRDRINCGRAADLLLLSGGVSMGKYDLVEQVLHEAGAEFFFTGVRIQPGKPVVFGRLPKLAPEYGTETDSPRNWTYFFGLPGNPVSTQVTFALFAAPLLRALGGELMASSRFIAAELEEATMPAPNLTRFLPAILTTSWERASARVIPWQGSGDQTASARADGFVVVPAGTAPILPGTTVRMLLL